MYTYKVGQFCVKILGKSLAFHFWLSFVGAGVNSDEEKSFDLFFVLIGRSARGGYAKVVYFCSGEGSIIQ